MTAVKTDDKTWIKNTFSKQPFRYGAKHIPVTSAEKLKPGEHLCVWKGTFPFYKHHAIVVKPMEIGNTKTQAKDKEFGVKDILAT